MPNNQESTIRTEQLQQECDDCGMVGALWASISHGTLLCDECASAHRNLGRHVSQVRCLKAGIAWPSTLLKMLIELCTGSQANMILEADSVVGTKPCAFDDYETKFSFIRQKYELLAFAKRSSQERRVNHQLRRAVHTNDLLGAFWLLLSGADPNWQETDEVTSTALCDCAALGRSSHLELLCIWGGDLSSADIQSIASSRGHFQLAERVGELENELVDRIVEFVVRRHRRVDWLDWQSNQTRSSSKDGRLELQQLPDPIFAELLRDIYDEIERRDCNHLMALLADWQRRSSDSLGRKCQDRVTVPFLPVNPYLSATRNQGRQKLARFSTFDFYLFLVDVVADLKRRNYGRKAKPCRRFAERVEATQAATSNSEEPLYDHVASENDDSDAAMSRELKLRVMRLESQLKQLTCVNEELKHQMLSLRQQLGVFQVQPRQTTVAASQYEPHISRISQNMESDYDNATAVVTSVDAEERLLSASCAEATGFPRKPTRTPAEQRDQFPSTSQVTYGPAVSVEDAIMRVIRRIGELHELIKRKQCSCYESTSRDVVAAVRELCQCANRASRAAPPLVNDLEKCATRLLGISQSFQQSQHVEHAMIDCCYQIGSCTKSLVALLAPSESSKDTSAPSANTLL